MAQAVWKLRINKFIGRKAPKNVNEKPLVSNFYRKKLYEAPVRTIRKFQNEFLHSLGTKPKS